MLCLIVSHVDSAVKMPPIPSGKINIINWVLSYITVVQTSELKTKGPNGDEYLLVQQSIYDAASSWTELRNLIFSMLMDEGIFSMKDKTDYQNADDIIRGNNIYEWSQNDFPVFSPLIIPRVNTWSN